jgi:hypothetical protein
MFGQQDCFTNAFQSVQNSLTAVSNRLSTVASSLISSTNLPVYLQNYTFSSGGVLTPYFTIVGGLPTNQSLRRTWNLVTAGMILLSGAPAQIIFTYDFSGVVSSYNVTIDGTLAGTFTLDGQVYDAATYFATPTYNYRKNILTLTLDLSKISLNTTGGDFSFNLFLADASTVCLGNSQCSIACGKLGSTNGVSWGGSCNNDLGYCTSTCNCYIKNTDEIIAIIDGICGQDNAT